MQQNGTQQVGGEVSLPTSFIDSSDRRWRLRMTLTAFARCKEEGFDCSADGWANAIADDPVLLGKVIWELARHDADATNKYPGWGEFADDVLTDGDVVARAIEAVFGAVINFTPPSRRGLAIRQWALRAAAEKKWAEAATDPRVESLINSSIDAMDARIAEVLAKAEREIREVKPTTSSE